MANLFVRLYLAMILTILLAAWIADLLLDRPYTEFLEWENKVLTETTARALHEELAIPDFAKRKAALERESSELLYHASLKPLASLDLSAEERRDLAAGNPVWRVEIGFWDDTLEMYQNDLDPNHVVHFTLGDYYDKPELAYEATVLGSLFTCTAIAIFFLLWPIVLRLQNLTEAARIFGEGDLGARVKKGGPTAIAELGNAFNTMAHQLQRARTHQEVMTHAISHEVRTPLARLRLTLDMAEDLELPELLETFVANMQSDVDDLEHLSNEMLGWAKLTFSREKVPLGPMDLRDTIQQTVERLQQIEPAIPIGFAPTSPLPCHGNPSLLQRALSNLIRNAQKYGAKTIAIHAAVEAGEVHIQVNDDGPGIPVDDRERIFAPFACVDESRSRSSGGFGLGMAIVERIMEAHRGNARILDSPLGGAGLRLTWPDQGDADPQRSGVHPEPPK
ncbi:Histidine kinase [Sulfidibacter corallicola]|uniref:histidine kinase n=1 Tax=Sulfidibacter corallicola TaxID=2818388 RepID=A0A8A4TJ16_SULCO|nr:ATP-binding protein [Sulfidibacter corallicola]QTD48841.1 HAMP domain-containing protein [Sulfidibacter corallicola]